MRMHFSVTDFIPIFFVILKKVNIKTPMFLSSKKRWFYRFLLKERRMLQVLTSHPNSLKKVLQSGHNLPLPPKGHLKWFPWSSKKKKNHFLKRKTASGLKGEDVENGHL